MEEINKNIKIVNIENDSPPNDTNIASFFIILCGVLSNVLFYTSTYKIKVNYFILILSIVSINIFIQYLFTKFYLNKKVVTVGMFLLLAIVVAMERKEVFSSLSELIKKIIHDNNLTSLRGQAFLDNSRGLAMLLLVYIVLVTMVINYIVKYNKTLVLTIFVMCPCLIGVVNGILPNNIVFILYISFIISILSMKCSKMKKKRKKNKINMFISDFNEIKIGIITLVITLSIFLILLVVYPQSSYIRSDKLTVMEENVEYFMKHGSLMSFINIFSNNIGTGGVDGGELGTIGKLQYDNKADLYVVINEDFIGSMYLPAFRGNEYKGNSWSPINEDKISKEIKYNVENINYDACRILQDTGYAQKENISISKCDYSVEKIDVNKKFNYIPYNTYIPGEWAKKIFQYYNRDNYLYGISSQLFDDYLVNNKILKNDDLDEFLSHEKSYSKYVYKEYTKYPKGIISDIERDIKDEYKGNNLLECIDKVDKLCKKGTKYTLEPSKLPKGKDFVDYFYTETKKGYCSHYASTATIMLRMMGIPARYVEGYVINKKDIEDADPIKETTETGDEPTRDESVNEMKKGITLTDKNAHAWVEVYVDKYGWVPVEVTPSSGYDDTKGEEDQEKKDSTVNTNDTSIDKNNEKSEDTKTYNKSNKESKQNLKAESEYRRNIILYFIGVMLITSIMSIKLRRIYIIRKRRKRFNLDDKRKAIINMYRYMNYLYIYLGMGDNLILNNKSNFFNQDKFSNVRDIVLKAKYGNKDLEIEEYEIMRAFVLSEAKRIYKSLGKIKKIEFKHFKCLI